MVLLFVNIGSPSQLLGGGRGSCKSTLNNLFKKGTFPVWKCDLAFHDRLLWACNLSAINPLYKTICWREKLLIHKTGLKLMTDCFRYKVVSSLKKKKCIYVPLIRKKMKVKSPWADSVAAFFLGVKWHCLVFVKQTSP